MSRRFAVALLVGYSIAASGPKPACAGEIDFDRQVAPILGSRCLECHSGAEPKGKLDLSRAKAALAGGESVVIVAGEPERSLLWQRVEGEEMPPKHPLPAAERGILKAWIAAGAKWGTDPIDRFRFTTATRAGYDWWSLKPIQHIELPPIADDKWAANMVDRFILHKLEAAGLRPSP